MDGRPDEFFSEQYELIQRLIDGRIWHIRSIERPSDKYKDEINRYIYQNIINLPAEKRKEEILLQIIDVDRTVKKDTRKEQELSYIDTLVELHQALKALSTFSRLLSTTDKAKIGGQMRDLNSAGLGYREQSAKDLILDINKIIQAKEQEISEALEQKRKLDLSSPHFKEEIEQRMKAREAAEQVSASEHEKIKEKNAALIREAQLAAARPIPTTPMRSTEKVNSSISQTPPQGSYAGLITKFKNSPGKINQKTPSLSIPIKIMSRDVFYDTTYERYAWRSSLLADVDKNLDKLHSCKNDVSVETALEDLISAIRKIKKNDVSPKKWEGLVELLNEALLHKIRILEAKCVSQPDSPLYKTQFENVLKEQLILQQQKASHVLSDFELKDKKPIRKDADSPVSDPINEFLRSTRR